MNIVANFLVTLCSVVIFIVHFPKCAQAVTMKVTFGNGRPSTVQALHNGQWKFSFETEHDNNGVLYKNINTRQWAGLKDDDPIDFKYENGTWIKTIKVSELRGKRKLYFPKNRHSYEINVFHNGQFIVRKSTIYERSQLKNYLEIEPEQWQQKRLDDVITFQRSNDGQDKVFAKIGVAVLRDTGSVFDLAKKKMYFEHNQQVKIEAKCHIYNFPLGKTTEEWHDGKMNQCFEIDVTDWENWKFQDNAMIHFHVKGQRKAFESIDVDTVRNNTGSILHLPY